MRSQRQHRIRIFRINFRAVTIALTLTMLFAVLAVLTPAAQAQTFHVIHTFTGAGDGGNPAAGVTYKAGNLYGTTYNYGTHGYGAVYQLKQKQGNWTVNPLYSFTGGKDGANPRARVVFGPGGSLFGTTAKGGSSNVGAVFELRPPASAPKSALFPWGETVLYAFEAGSDGAYPGYGDLIFDGAGNIYDNTIQGGKPYNAGCAYELTPSGGGYTESLLYCFGGGSDGVSPYDGLNFDNAGNLYGTTYNGGLHGNGTVFQLVPVGDAWMENIIYSFQNGKDGALPDGGVIAIVDQLGNLNLYGITSYGGTGGAGTVFQLTYEGNNNWSFTTLYSFTGSHNCGSNGNLMVDGAGNFYGTTYCAGANNLGSVFKLTPTAQPPWTYTSLHDFTGGNDGKIPYGNVIFDANGNLYGTASAGGSQGVGVVWEITP